MSALLHGDLGLYLLIILAGFLPTDVWRWLAVVSARKLDEDSELMIFIRGVANAMVAGVIMRLVLFPTGDLASVPLVLRAGSVVVAFAVYFLLKRSMLAGVLAGEAVMIAGAYYFTLPH
ncbi:MAG TPA: AzlD domain-containing protein [Xanthobacteraceae bacterium]|nr:AzlD domain-containing protein [Xanthobacteraceae bacterium]